MSIAALPASLVSRRRGRPRVADDRRQRLKHIRAAGLLLSGHYTAKGIAALHGVSLSTIYNWRDLALGYADPEAEGLRRLAESSPAPARSA